MKEILKHVNEKLKEHNIKLIEKEVIDEHDSVMEKWNEIIKTLSTPIDFLIVGEATVNFKNYFYNPKAPITSFLTPSHFGIECQKKKGKKEPENDKCKSKLIELFNQNKILVFDLYPLPLPTFIYDNIKFDCLLEHEYVQAMTNYYKNNLTDNNIINENTVIVSRYAKFYKEKKDNQGQVVLDKNDAVKLDEKRFEWGIFMDAINRKHNDFQSIHGSYTADSEKIKSVFKKIFDNPI